MGIGYILKIIYIASLYLLAIFACTDSYFHNGTGLFDLSTQAVTWGVCYEAEIDYRASNTLGY